MNLGSLDLYVNSLEGTIPSQLGRLMNLEVLSLTDNSLAGTIPSELGNLMNLGSLNLNDNWLKGTIPSELGKLVNLEVLDLNDNALYGTIPSELGHLVNLEVLAHCDNSLLGTIPSELSNLVNLAVMFLFGNSLEGTIPSALGSLRCLEALDVNHNSLSGVLPLSIVGWEHLQSANLSTNRFSGPTETFAVKNFTSLQVLDLSLNRFTGTIPASVFALPMLQAVILSQNCFSGNLFGCQQNDIPQSDVNRGTSQCGSVDFQYSLLVWSAGFALCVVVGTFGSDWIVQVVEACRSREVVRVLVGPICCLAVCVIGLVGFVTMKLCSDITYASTYAVQYWWTSTVTFVHDWNVSIFLFFNLVAICAVFTMTVISFTDKSGSMNSRTTIPTPLIYYFFAHLVNVIIVAAANMVYVLTAIGSVNNTALLVIQTVLGMFKLAWSSWAIPRLLSWARIAENQKLCHWTFMVLFVFLGAPFASSFCESSSCLFTMLWSAMHCCFSFS
jgi:hypothetical protein